MVNFLYIPQLSCEPRSIQYQQLHQTQLAANQALLCVLGIEYKGFPYLLVFELACPGDGQLAYKASKAQDMLSNITSSTLVLQGQDSSGDEAES